MAGCLLFSLMCVLVLLVKIIACYPIPTRALPEFPLDFEALAEMPVKHLDDYGVGPKPPSFHPRVPYKPPKGLEQARKSKRIEPEIMELFYDDLM